MSIVIIGGHDRMHKDYEKICLSVGIQSKIFTQMNSSLSKSIGNPDAILLFTNTVSHKMSKAALLRSKKDNIPLIRCHTSSGSALKSILCDLKNF